MTNIEKAERDAEAAASSLAVFSPPSQSPHRHTQTETDRERQRGYSSSPLEHRNRCSSDGPRPCAGSHRPAPHAHRWVPSASSTLCLSRTRTGALPAIDLHGGSRRSRLCRLLCASPPPPPRPASSRRRAEGPLLPLSATVAAAARLLLPARLRTWSVAKAACCTEIATRTAGSALWRLCRLSLRLWWAAT